MKEQVVNIETLVQDDHNFNKGTEAGRELMERSFKQLGAGRSIVIDKDGRIIAGNKSQQAAMAAGIKKVRIIETQGDELVAVKRTDLSLDSKEGRELALADNLTTQINLQWDEAELQSVAAQEGIDLEDWGMDAVAKKEAEEDDFDESTDKVETRCKTGDLWQLGEHRLLCGDCTKPADIQKLMQGEFADLWLTDPPYNVDIMGGSHADFDRDGQKIANDKFSDDKFYDFCKEAFGATAAALKKGGAFYVWTTQGHPLVQVAGALDEVGLHFRQQLCWVKNTFVFGRMDYQGQHEPCFYGWKEGAAHHFIKLHNEPTTLLPATFEKMSKQELIELLNQVYEDSIASSVIYEDRPTRSADHPTMKPVKLFGRLVRNSSRKGEIVLDTFGGSGTTIVACEQLNRKARLMELDPHYCDVIIARWEKLTGQKATRL